MKPKSNRKPGPIDNCGTPVYALDPLLPYLYRTEKIWEPAQGQGRLVRAFQAYGFSVVGTGLDYIPTGEVDPQTSEALYTTVGDDFLTSTPTEHWTTIITNPPYAIKRPWLRRCYELGHPFALLLPVENLGSGEVQELMKKYGGEVLLLNRRVNFVMYDGPGGEPSEKQSAAQFPVYWHCWKLLPEKLVYGTITHRHPDQLLLVEEPA